MKNILKINSIIIALILMFSINCFADINENIDNMGITSGSTSMTTEEANAVTNVAMINYYLDKSEKNANAKGEKWSADEALKNYDPTKFKCTSVNLEKYLPAAKQAVKNKEVSFSDNKTITIKYKTTSVEVPTVTNADREDFTKLSSESSSFISDQENKDMQAEAMKKIINQYGKDIQNSSELSQLFGFITDSDEMVAALKAKGMTDADIKEWMTNNEAGLVTAGVLTYANENIEKMAMDIGCSSPTELLSYINKLTEQTGIIAELAKTTDWSNMEQNGDVMTFLQQASTIQSFYQQGWKAIYAQLSGSKIEITNGSMGGFVIDENGQLIGTPQFFGEIPADLKNVKINISGFSEEIKKIMASWENTQMYADHKAEIEALMAKKEWTIADFLAFQEFTGADVGSGTRKKFEVVYNGTTTNIIGTGIFNPTETHTYLSNITYAIKKSDGSRFSSVCMTWSDALMEQYMTSLESFGTRGQSASYVFRKWKTAITKFNTANGTSIPTQFPNVSLSISGNTLTGEMNFEKYLSDNLGGTITDNVLIQDFIRNFYSDIKSNTYSRIYRTSLTQYYRLAVAHTTVGHYDRQNVDLSYLSCPMAFKLDSGTLVYGYEILVTAYLKQIVNEAAFVASGVSTSYSAIGQIVQWYPYRQYIVQKNGCSFIGSGKRFTLDEIKKRYAKETILNLNDDNKIVEVKNRWSRPSEYDDYGSEYRTFFICDDDTHSNLNLAGIDTVATSASGSSPAVQGTTLHIHTIRLTNNDSNVGITCRTAAKLIPIAQKYNIDLYKDEYQLTNVSFNDFNNLKNSTLNSLGEKCEGWTFEVKGCDNHNGWDTREVSNSAPAGYKGVAKDWGTHTERYEKNCPNCGGYGDTQNAFVKIYRYYTLANQWDSHKHDCFYVCNSTTEDSIDASTSETHNYIGIKDCDIESKYVYDDLQYSRLSNVVDYKHLTWKYKGKIYTWANSGGVIIVFDDIITGDGVQVENFISM